MTENSNKAPEPTDHIGLYPTLHRDVLPTLELRPTAPPVAIDGIPLGNPPPYSVTDPLQPQIIRTTSFHEEALSQQPISIYGLRRASLQEYINQRNANVHPISSPFGTDSVMRRCPYCHKQMMTSVVKSPNMCTYISAFVLCLIGLNCCCCLIPFCIDSCNDVEHHCSECNAYLGRYNGFD